MNSITSSYFKGLAITGIILSLSIGFAFIIDESFVMLPEHNIDNTLFDDTGDVDDDYVDIVSYGSYDAGDSIVLYIEVAGQLNESANYQLFIVAKFPGNSAAHIYANIIDVEQVLEENYASPLVITDHRIEVHFAKVNFFQNSYMVGIEARATSMYSEDNSLSARDNPVQTQFLGIF